MAIFSDTLWGYRLVYPDDWFHQSHGDIEAFAAVLEALSAGYNGPGAGHIVIRPEFNHSGESIEPLWDQHLSKLSIMMGAKKVGSAPLTLGGGRGFEAEIVLPRQKEQRMWLGILAHRLTILHIMATHPIENREWFNPIATEIISSTRFYTHIKDLLTTDLGIPIPKDYTVVDPIKVIQNLDPPHDWQAYSGNSNVHALQAFYTRELSGHGWEIDEFIPFPNSAKNPFAHLHINNNKCNATLILIPSTSEEGTCAVVINTNIRKSNPGTVAE